MTEHKYTSAFIGVVELKKKLTATEFKSLKPKISEMPFLDGFAFTASGDEASLTLTSKDEMDTLVISESFLKFTLSSSESRLNDVTNLKDRFIDRFVGSISQLFDIANISELVVIRSMTFVQPKRGYDLATLLNEKYTKDLVGGDFTFFYSRKLNEESKESYGTSHFHDMYFFTVGVAPKEEEKETLSKMNKQDDVQLTLLTRQSSVHDLENKDSSTCRKFITKLLDETEYKKTLEYWNL